MGHKKKKQPYLASLPFASKWILVNNVIIIILHAKSKGPSRRTKKHRHRRATTTNLYGATSTTLIIIITAAGAVVRNRSLLCVWLLSQTVCQAQAHSPSDASVGMNILHSSTWWRKPLCLGLRMLRVWSGVTQSIHIAFPTLASGRFDVFSDDQFMYLISWHFVLY